MHAYLVVAAGDDGEEGRVCPVLPVPFEPDTQRLAEPLLLAAHLHTDTQTDRWTDR